MAGRGARGVAHWRGDSSQRIFSVRGDYLVSVSTETGSLVRDFGDDGKVDLTRESEGPNSPFFRSGGTSGPIVVGDVVIVGGGGGDDFSVYQEGDVEDVRGYDVRTGRLRWTFHVVPRPRGIRERDMGRRLMEDRRGYRRLAAPHVDEELGYIYLPMSSPMHAFYGGDRPGQNLFGNRPRLHRRQDRRACVALPARAP